MPTLTINIESMGTPLRNGGASNVGHMWFSVTDNSANSRAFKTTQHWANIAKICTLALSLVLPACSSPKIGKSGLPMPPIRLPFAVEKAGSKIETEVEVVDYRNYIFSLDFMYKENDQTDRARVKKLVGDDMQDKDDDPGVPTPLHFKIILIDATGEKPIVDQKIRDLRLRSWGGDNLDKHIAYVNLKPGHYRISVESLVDAPELIGTPIFFTMGSYAKASNIK